MWHWWICHIHMPSLHPNPQYLFLYPQHHLSETLSSQTTILLKNTDKTSKQLCLPACCCCTSNHHIILRLLNAPGTSLHSGVYNNINIACYKILCTSAAIRQFGLICFPCCHIRCQWEKKKVFSLRQVSSKRYKLLTLLNKMEQWRS